MNQFKTFLTPCPPPLTSHPDFLSPPPPQILPHHRPSTDLGAILDVEDSDDCALLGSCGHLGASDVEGHRRHRGVVGRQHRLGLLKKQRCSERKANKSEGRYFVGGLITPYLSIQCPTKSQTSSTFPYQVLTVSSQDGSTKNLFTISHSNQRI